MRNKNGVYNWTQEAKKLYPGITAANRGWAKQYGTMMSRICSWQTLYSLEQVVLLVKDESRRTRSPGKYQAIADWWRMMEETLDTTC